MEAALSRRYWVAVVLLAYLYARLQHEWHLEESREAQMVRLGSKVVASDLLKRGRLWRDVTGGGERPRHNSLTNRPHWFLDSLLLLAGDIELNPGPLGRDVEYDSSGDEADCVTDDGWPWSGKKTHYPPYKRNSNKMSEITLQEQDGKLTTIYPKRPYTRQGKPEEFYPMKPAKLPHGIALIISNKFFADSRHGMREGTEKDVRNLRKAFRYLGYEVLIRRDCTSVEMKGFFKPGGLVFQRAKKEHDSFVCCILSHGSSDEVIGADSEPVNIGKQNGIQYEVAHCVTLKKKPKLFFIQACRGSGMDDGVTYYDSGGQIEFDFSMLRTKSDFYISYTMVYQSTRHMDYGSRYVLEQCRALVTDGHNSTLSSMQRAVNKSAGEYCAVTYQQPLAEDLLSSSVYFFEDMLPDLHGRELRFKAAMEKGHVKLRVSTVFLHGPAGSGKTCSGCFLVGEDPPSERKSTAVARPMRIFCVNVSKKDSEWEKLTPKQRMDYLVKTVESHPIQQEVKETQPNVDASQPSIEQSIESHNDKAETITSEDVNDSSVVHEHSEPPVPSQTTPVDIPKLKTADDLAKLIENHSESSPIELDMMHIIDTGGQPQCHELMRYFVKRQTSLYIFVFKLSDEFSIKPLIAYYVNGKCVSGEQCAKETIEKILQQCVRTIQSHKHADVQSHTGADMQSNTGVDKQKFRILFLGTHKDQESNCSEDIKAKNEKITNMVLAGCKENLSYYKSSQLIFPVDVSPLSEEEKKTWGCRKIFQHEEVRKDEKTIFANIRKFITEKCPFEDVHVPLQYYGLEVLLEDLSKTEGRKVFTRSECLAASKQLHFSEDAFDDAIKHLDDLCLIYHYRSKNIIPEINIVFTDIQVLLDIITELVQASCDEMQHKHVCDDHCKQSRFYGIVTKDFLCQEMFKKHYKSGCFTAEDLIELFRDFLVFADLNQEKGEYFVPALLGAVDDPKLYRRISPSAAALSPLVLLFPNGGPQLGVFCYLIAYLLSSENKFPSAWKLKKKDDKITPECLKSNCVVFSIPEIADSVSLIDSFHHLEVHVDGFSKFRTSDCTTAILQALGEGLSKANEKLSYNEDLPEISIACPCEKGKPEFHHATFYNRKSDDYWICSKVCSNSELLRPEDFAWLKSHRAVSGETSMPPKLTVTLDRRSTPDEDEEDNEDDEEYDSSGDEAGNVEIDGWPWPGKKTRYPPYGRRGDAIEIKLQEQNGTLSTITPSKAYGRPAVVCYPMKQLPHGIALIISNKKFDSARERLGTEKDEQHLRRTFRFLGYEVLVRRNCNGGKMRSFFNRNGLVSKKVKPHHNSFVCCILSHGGPDFVCGKDDVRVSIGISDGIQYKLCIAKNFPSLNGKPKLFFIQACRGHQIREVDHLPPEDVFVGYATSPDEVAYRDKRYGSPYVLELCRVLLEKSHNNDLISMHQEVEGIVPRKHKEVTNVPDPANPGRMKEVCQKPCHDAHLPKKVYFFDDTAA